MWVLGDSVKRAQKGSTWRNFRFISRVMLFRIEYYSTETIILKKSLKCLQCKTVRRRLQSEIRFSIGTFRIYIHTNVYLLFSYGGVLLSPSRWSVAAGFYVLSTQGRFQPSGGFSVCEIYAPTVGQSPDMVAADILHRRVADTLK